MWKGNSKCAQMKLWSRIFEIKVNCVVKRFSMLAYSEGEKNVREGRTFDGS
jgi:hypothetical protein